MEAHKVSSAGGLSYRNLKCRRALTLEMMLNVYFDKGSRLGGCSCRFP